MVFLRERIAIAVILGRPEAAKAWATLFQGLSYFSLFFLSTHLNLLSINRYVYNKKWSRMTSKKKTLAIQTHKKKATYVVQTTSYSPAIHTKKNPPSKSHLSNPMIDPHSLGQNNIKRFIKLCHKPIPSIIMKVLHIKPWSKFSVEGRYD